MLEKTVAEPKQSEIIISELRRNHVHVKNIGKMMAQAHGIKLVTKNDDEIDLPEFHQDEITKLFGREM